MSPRLPGCPQGSADLRVPSRLHGVAWSSRFSRPWEQDGYRILDPGFPNCSTMTFWVMILCYEGCPLRCRRLGSIPGSHPPLQPQLMTTRNVSIHCQDYSPGKQNHPFFPFSPSCCCALTPPHPAAGSESLLGFRSPTALSDWTCLRSHAHP